MGKKPGELHGEAALEGTFNELSSDAKFGDMNTSLTILALKIYQVTVS